VDGEEEGGGGRRGAARVVRKASQRSEARGQREDERGGEQVQQQACQMMDRRRRAETAAQGRPGQPGERLIVAKVGRRERPGERALAVEPRVVNERGPVVPVEEAVPRDAVEGGDRGEQDAEEREGVRADRGGGSGSRALPLAQAPHSSPVWSSNLQMVRAPA
jgi:hypothetical protein